MEAMHLMICLVQQPSPMSVCPVCSSSFRPSAHRRLTSVIESTEAVPDSVARSRTSTILFNCVTTALLHGAPVRRALFDAFSAAPAISSHAVVAVPARLSDSRPTLALASARRTLCEGYQRSRSRDRRPIAPGDVVSLATSPPFASNYAKVASHGPQFASYTAGCHTPHVALDVVASRECATDSSIHSIQAIS
ncbi:hypothetical protein MSAN_00627700 [Mycena sanguinolenta]|uniref:Uncharacterized protein n=1 Tax=Mycena sanguinolenta TaxID=230812 RepID=A0A8H6YZM5_9AGAR|nr:hypothetical protein MSAN_00627700 [Mycena sanguinolenta]